MIHFFLSMYAAKLKILVSEESHLRQNSSLYHKVSQIISIYHIWVSHRWI